MDYTINRLITDADFDAVDARTRAALAANGFGAPEFLARENRRWFTMCFTRV